MTSISTLTPPRRIIRRRAGMGLIETVGLVATTGILLSFAAIALGRAFQCHAQALNHLQRTQQQQNACYRLRTDVHAAMGCTVNDGHLTLDLGHGKTIRYISSGADKVNPLAAGSKLGDFGTLLTRVIFQADAQAVSGSNKELSREQWQLERVSQIRWEIDQSGQLPLVMCELVRVPDLPIVWMSRARKPSASTVENGESEPEGHADEEGSAQE